jgi:uncharacterized phage protein (TIGR01671 family)
MNRIPNYRVWHKIEKRYIDLRSIDFEKENIGYDAYREGNYYDVASFKDVVFQQFIELYDKNKKPIYEGDRVRFAYTENRDFFGEVVWFKDRATFGVKAKNAGEYFSDLVDYMQFFEVVGNIFELPCNPDHNGECLVCDEWLDGCPFNVDNSSKI